VIWYFGIKAATQKPVGGMGSCDGTGEKEKHKRLTQRS